MKNKHTLWLLALMGLVGCKDSNNVGMIDAQSNNNTTAKIDTALVLYHKIHTYGYPGYNILCNKDGKVYDVPRYLSNKYKKGEHYLSDCVNIGDTVIVALDKRATYIIRNLTLENKIKAFSR